MEPILFDFKHMGIIQYDGLNSRTRIRYNKLLKQKELLESISSEISDFAEDYDFICGVDILADMVSAKSGVPLILLSDETDYEITSKSRCLLIVGIVTSSNSVKTIIKNIIKTYRFKRNNIHPITIFNLGISDTPHLWALADIAPKRLCADLSNLTTDEILVIFPEISAYIDIVKLNQESPTLIEKFHDANIRIVSHFAKSPDYAIINDVNMMTIGVINPNSIIKLDIENSGYTAAIGIINKYRRNIHGVIVNNGEEFSQQWLEFGEGPRPEIWTENVIMQTDCGMRCIPDIITDVYMVNFADIDSSYKSYIDVYNGKPNEGTFLYVDKSNKGVFRVKQKITG